MSELFDLWETQNLTPEEYDENVAAIRASINDMLAGETGRDAAQVIHEVRTELNLPSQS
ncbi:hypothetical protein [Rubinisphaera margarita]|uniref:hypothetical protein n=1 Tax=Rubinisphaera margarita TaxID=2909586 RepID=UPI001EE78497|nr:hypothetical protein [Rubinisphaera margarita]